MKRNPNKFFFLYLISIVLMASNCKKDSVENELSKLPAVTYTGTNTFGCLVNGKAFLPSVGPGITSTLRSTYDSSIGFLNLFANNTSNKDVMTTVHLQAVGTLLQENKIYPLTEYSINNKASGSYELYYPNQGPPSIYYRTNNQTTGTLTITKLDLVKHILSGTFTFDSINGSGEIVHVTDGRFDVVF
ncbi:MAG: hypothetical protein EOP45_06760 [Sphingobacteriaceae bacterium]|nr:MAG: hypothetical protein EOP45_06760 [Sphingobacteriaceae bacterium]